MLHRANRPILWPTSKVLPRPFASNFRLPLAPKLLALLLVLAGLLTAPAAHSQDQDEIKGIPAEPADEQQIRDQIAAVEKLQPTLPDRGAVLYFLAAAKERLRDTLGALALVKECLALQEGFDPSGDPAFLELKDSADFTEMIETVHTEFPAESQAREAFRTTERDLLPDGLAYDKQRNVFYLGSLNRRKIVEIGRESNVSDFVPQNEFDLLPIRGITLDPEDDTVWADSFSDGGRTELLHFDGAGKLLGRFKPTGSGKHGFNNLVVRKNGDVVTTDSLANAVFRFEPAAHTFKSIPVHRPLFYPNGIALTSDDLTLYVADGLGVVKIDLATGESRDVDPGPRTTLAGIDGLYWYKGALIAIQNGMGSPRVAAFRLSSDGLRVAHTTVLENRSHFCASPTTGAIVGSEFFFIANSQLDNMNDGHVMDVTRLQPARVGVLRLP
jgi:hypothetical protein